MVLGTEREMFLYHREIYSSSYNPWITVLPKERCFFSLFCCSLKTAGFPFTGHLTIATLNLLKGQYCDYNPKPAELLQLMKRHK